MQSSIEEITPIIGTSMGGGFYAGRIRVDGNPFAIIVAPKALGERAGMAWIARGKDVPGALSYSDGLANTRTMAEAGSKLAAWVLGLSIGGAEDWYLASQDELEICYRNLKPGANDNSCYGRSGINLSALQPTYPYTPAAPAQTQAEVFQAGGAEAFEPDFYWSSTRHASNSAYAWTQLFSNGSQSCNHTINEFRVRVVRRLAL